MLNSKSLLKQCEIANKRTKHSILFYLDLKCSLLKKKRKKKGCWTALFLNMTKNKYDVSHVVITNETEHRLRPPSVPWNMTHSSGAFCRSAPF